MKYLYSLLFLLSLPISAFNVIYTSEYIDVLNEKVILDSSITIDEGLIVSIDSGYIEVDKTNTLIDLRGIHINARAYGYACSFWSRISLKE